MTAKQNDIQQLTLLVFSQAQTEESFDYSLYQKTAAALIIALRIQIGGEIGLILGIGIEKSAEQAILIWLRNEWPELSSRNVKRRFDGIKDVLAARLIEHCES